jgi:uncharacterized protein (DUF2141 family)/uncharacterized membrane protein
MKNMRALFNIPISIFLATLFVAAPCAAESVLSITVDGFQSDAGLARIILFDSPASYEGTAPPYRIVSGPIRDRRATWSGFDLPKGTYVAIVHHDENINDELDRPYFSLPLEPYGFSNNAFKALGIPDFEAVKFNVVDGLNTQRISIRHNPIATAVLAIRPFINLIALTIVLVLPLLVCSVFRRWLGAWAYDTQRLGRFGLTLLLLMTSSAHFISAENMTMMLPDWVPVRIALIYATGVLSVILALGLWIPGSVRRVGFAIMTMLVVFLSANIYAALNSVPYGGAEMGASYLLVRVPYQIFLVWWTVWATGLAKRRHI